MTNKIKWVLMNNNKDIENLSLQDDQSEFEKDEEEKYGGMDIQTKKLIPTPFGLAVVDNSISPFNDLQLWLFHTNFLITQEVINSIESTPGCEILRIISPYRGVLSVGECFNSLDFRREIERRLIKKEIINQELKANIEELKKRLDIYTQFSILVFPNGYCDFVFLKPDYSNINEYIQVTELYKDAQKLSNSILIQKPK